VHERTVSRLAREIREKGLLGIKHGNFQRRPKDKTPDNLKDQVCSLLREEYFDMNITHAKEILNKKHQIKVPYTTLRRWCHELHLVKRMHHRAKKKPRKLRPRSQREGFLLQMDGSPHMYNRHEEWVLIAPLTMLRVKCLMASFLKPRICLIA
jgi:transposase